MDVVDAGGADRATHSTATVALAVDDAAVDAPDLRGATAVTAVAGRAEFTALGPLSPSAFDYRLAATADYDVDATIDATADSAPFDIVDAQATCRAGQRCRARAVDTDSAREVEVSFETRGAASLLVSYGAGDVPPFECDGVPVTAPAAQFFLIGPEDPRDLTGTLRLTIPGAAPPANGYGVCWAAPDAFETDDGVLTERELDEPIAGKERLYVGLLPRCDRRAPEAPCVTDRDLDQRTSTLRIDVLVDGRDPWTRT